MSYPGHQCPPRGDIGAYDRMSYAFEKFIIVNNEMGMSATLRAYTTDYQFMNRRCMHA